MYTFGNANQTLIGMSKQLVQHGVWREVRGLKCLELPHPVLIQITNPTDRCITITERKWNRYLPFAESLWLALGLNDLALPGKYVKRLYEYSDDGITMRGGYGPRLRGYSGIATDYNVKMVKDHLRTTGHVNTVDQLRYVVESLNRDINTRQAIIEIGDPVKDDFDEHDNLKVTKDYPCSRSLQFMMVNGRLNCTLYIRSNDILYGMSGVNIFNFTWMQEYIANIIGVPIGVYYHFCNNLHVYDNFYDRVQQLAAMDIDQYGTGPVCQYKDKLHTLKHFDSLITHLYQYERGIFRNEFVDPITMGNDMFDDWVNAFRHHQDPTRNLKFNSTYLNTLFNS